MAIRIVVQVTGDRVELLRAIHVDMPAPGGPVLIAPPDSGMYVELRGEMDEPVFRKSIAARVDQGIEVFGENGVPRRVEDTERTETLMLVLPDDRQPRSIAFLRGGGPGAGGRRRARSDSQGPNELASFSLDGVVGS